MEIVSFLFVTRLHQSVDQTFWGFTDKSRETQSWVYHRTAPSQVSRLVCKAYGEPEGTIQGSSCSQRWNLTSGTGPTGLPQPNDEIKLVSTWLLQIYLHTLQLPLAVVSPTCPHWKAKQTLGSMSSPFRNRCVLSGLNMPACGINLDGIHSVIDPCFIDNQADNTSPPPPRVAKIF